MTAITIALQSLYERGWRKISAATLADELWPKARRNNANGQQFNLAAGVAGKMLRKSRMCREVGDGMWEIIYERLRRLNAADQRPPE